MTDTNREIVVASILGLVVFGAAIAFPLGCYCGNKPEPTPAAQYDDGLHSLLVPEAQP